MPVQRRTAPRVREWSFTIFLQAGGSGQASEGDASASTSGNGDEPTKEEIQRRYDAFRHAQESKITGCRIQCERTKAGQRLHLQGVVCFGKQHRQPGVVAALSALGTAHVEPCRNAVASDFYCRKEETRVKGFPILELGRITTVGEKTSAGRVAKASKGKWCLKEVLAKGDKTERMSACLQEMFEAKSITAATIKIVDSNPLSIHQVKVCAEHTKIKKAFIERKKKRDACKKAQLRKWQKELLSELRRPADDRKVICYLDKKGNSGKSWFRTWYGRRYPDSFCYVNGGSDSVKYVLSRREIPPRVIFADLCRTGEVKDQNRDFTNYSLYEEMKNGSFTTTKYMGDEIDMLPPHLVIFCNQPLNWSKLSSDRWDIRTFGKDGSVQYHKIRLDKEGLPMSNEDGNWQIEKLSGVPVDVSLAHAQSVDIEMDDEDEEESEIMAAAEEQARFARRLREAYDDDNDTDNDM